MGGNNTKGVAPCPKTATEYKTNFKQQNQHMTQNNFNTKSIMEDSLAEWEKLKLKFKNLDEGGSLWKYGIIPFEISDNIRVYHPDIEKLILDAVELCNKSLKHVFWIPKHFHNKTNLCYETYPFQVKEQDVPSILFVTDEGYPRSYVGCYGQSQQKIWIPLTFPSGTKVKVGNVLHEMTHAMGFQHEHSRTDRDEYLDIDKKNENNSNYVKDGIAFGKYDFDSIMHYGHGGCRVKIKYKKEGKNIGQRKGYSVLDKKGINEIYAHQRENIDHLASKCHGRCSKWQLKTKISSSYENYEFKSEDDDDALKEMFGQEYKILKGLNVKDIGQVIDNRNSLGYLTGETVSCGYCYIESIINSQKYN